MSLQQTLAFKYCKELNAIGHNIKTHYKIKFGESMLISKKETVLRMCKDGTIIPVSSIMQSFEAKKIFLFNFSSFFNSPSLLWEIIGFLKFCNPAFWLFWWEPALLVSTKNARSQFQDRGSRTSGQIWLADNQKWALCACSLNRNGPESDKILSPTKKLTHCHALRHLHVEVCYGIL